MLDVPLAEAGAEKGLLARGETAPVGGWTLRASLSSDGDSKPLPVWPVPLFEVSNVLLQQVDAPALPL